MAGKILKESKSLSGVEVAAAVATEAVVSSVKCCCCGLTEECTETYIARVRERYDGRWICGLCSEAVKEEKVKNMITMDEALKRHMKFCHQFTSSTPPKHDDFILAMKQIMFRTLDSPRKDRFACRPLGRSHSCFSALPVTPTQTDAE